MGFGWGSAIGKIFDWFPGRKEKILNNIKKLERQIDELQSIPRAVDNDPAYAAAYDVLATKLRDERSKLEALQ